MAAETKVNHFGTSAPYILANKKADIDPKANYDLSNLRSIGGMTIPKAIESGYDNAIRAIVDSNVTTLLVTTILYIYGTGPISGLQLLYQWELLLL